MQGHYGYLGAILGRFGSRKELGTYGSLPCHIRQPDRQASRLERDMRERGGAGKHCQTLVGDICVTRYLLTYVIATSGKFLRLIRMVGAIAAIGPLVR